MNNVAYVPVIQVCLICQLFDTIGIDSFVSIAHTLFIMFLYAADFNNAMLLSVPSLDLCQTKAPPGRRPNNDSSRRGLWMPQKATGITAAPLVLVNRIN